MKSSCSSHFVSNTNVIVFLRLLDSNDLAWNDNHPSKNDNPSKGVACAWEFRTKLKDSESTFGIKEAIS